MKLLNINKNSLSYRIIFRILLFCTIIWLVIFSVYYTFTRHSIRSNTIEQAKLLTENMVNKIEKTLQPIEILPENLSWMAETGNIPKDSVYSFLESMIKNNPEVYASAIAFEPYTHDSKTKYWSPYAYREGDKIMTKQLGSEAYDYFIMDWYQIPATLHKPYWSEPYFDTGGANALISTYSVPFYTVKNGKRVFSGIITVDVSLDWLTQIVNETKILESGYAFLITRSGTYVTNPNKSLIMNETIFTMAKESDQPEIREIGRRMINGETGSYSFKHKENGKITVYYINLPSNKWSIGLVLPNDEMYADLFALNIFIIVLAILGLAILVIFTVRIIQNQLKPLSKFSKSAQTIAKGNFQEALPVVTTDDEMKELHDSFEFMQKELSNYVANLKETTSAKEKIESELRIAKEIQLGMIPHIFPPFPDLPEIDLFASLVSAREVGGDLYDFFLLDKHVLCFAIGDVSGKGIPSSLFMAVTRTLLRSSANKDKSAAEIVTLINKTLSLNNESNMFVTLFLGILDTTTGKLNYCNAGHNPPIFINNGKDAEYFTFSKGIPVGLFEDHEYLNEYTFIKSGDQLFMYTDGVSEAENSENVLYGNERLIDVVRNNSTMKPKLLIEAVNEDIARHVNGYLQSDDLTMLSIINYGSER
jgi:sigma-B regulation protein RsbU (phosphoserine phosphatase)